MTEVRTSSLCDRPCAGIEDTLEASIGTRGPQSVFDAAMAPTQESGLRENCTSRLSERAEAGRMLHLSRLYSYEAGEQSERAHCGGIYRGKRSGAGGAKGGGQGECAPAKHALDSEPGSRVTGAGAYTASNCRHTPEVGAVCGKAARTVLCGGRDENRVPTATREVEAPRLHHAARRRSRGAFDVLAALSERGASADAGDWIPEQRVAPIVRARSSRVPPGPQGSRLCRGPKHRDRIPLGGGAI